MKLEKLQKQKAAIEAQIEQAALVEKKRARVEKLIGKLLKKYPAVCLADLELVESKLDETFSIIVSG